MTYITLNFGFTFARFCQYTGTTLDEIRKLNPDKTANDIYIGAKWRIQ